MSNLTDGELKLIIPSVNDDIKQTIGVDLGNNFTKIDDGVSEINSNITILKGDINISNTKLDDKIDTVESNTKTNRDKINLVETDVKDSQDKISILNAKVKPEAMLNTTSQDLSGAVNEVKGELDEHKEDYAKQAEYPIVNLLKNSNFNNAEGWIISSSSSYTIINNELILTKNNSGNGQVWQNVTMNIGDKYYVKVDMLSDRIGDGSEVVGVIGHFGMRHSGSGEYEKLSYIIEATATTHAIRVIRSDSPREVSPLGIRIKKPMLVNLTSVFGKGNEPTKEEMDLLLEQIGAFDGKITLTQKEIFNWQTAINRKQYERIEQLENAITELGGTI